ncbi:helix-turn-helix domain-containing protein [Pigmentiphaga aceris]|uniref:Helix-turn-helix domain-containing protein n=1 Tax=Pigmentiphaga aceris TaxID=1940612 RepID=A0A5C0ATP0_9BURK|nr:type II TA system antitoxin MqsA family protein [Pigmentiphaga aceris]QEI05465.1 helix-turn-helix domain-containing protein [Pigmentiphaga aceris]
MHARQAAPEVCRECGTPHPVYEIRDVKIAHRGLEASVADIRGWFCVDPACEEIEFDESTDSLERWVAAGDALVLKERARAKQIGERLRRSRQTLHLSQVEAAALAGGGHNAFSRYENGGALPVAAVTTLFSLLERHPELVHEARALAAETQRVLMGEATDIA